MKIAKLSNDANPVPFWPIGLDVPVFSISPLARVWALDNLLITGCDGAVRRSAPGSMLRSHGTPLRLAYVGRCGYDRYTKEINDPGGERAWYFKGYRLCLCERPFTKERARLFKAAAKVRPHYLDEGSQMVRSMWERLRSLLLCRYIPRVRNLLCKTHRPNALAIADNAEVITLEERMRFCREEFERTFISDRELFRLCNERAGKYLPETRVSIPLIIERIARAVETKSSFALMRVGNGEGNALSMTKSILRRPIVEAFYDEFCSQNHHRIELSAAVSFCHDLRAALCNADVLGFRSFRGDELALIETAIEHKNAYASLGVTYAREFLQELLANGLLANKIVTSAWIHLDLIPFLRELFALSDRIIVVTGRVGLRREFEKRLGSRLAGFIPIPIQGSTPNSIEESHFYREFPRVKKDLSRDLRGHLLLIGAGLFGKIYCDRAKRHGAVAIDLGSVFDVLSGENTRPVFSRYSFKDVAWT